MKTRLLLPCALCALLAAQAQPPTSETSQSFAAATASTDASAIDELSTRLDALEKKTTTWDKVRSYLPQISGYIQLRYQWDDAEQSSFDVRRARFSLKGDIGSKLDYRLQVEFASKVQIVDAYVQYKPFRQFNVKAGQYKIPFTIENTDYAPLKFEFIDYPMALRKLMGFSEVIGGETLSATGRDMGLSFYGGFGRRSGYDLVSYDFGIFNGSGINKSDNNRSKDVVGRLTVRPVAGLSVSGSYYWGEYGKAYLKRQRYAVGACYDRGPVVVRSEWVGGTTGIAATETAPANDLHSDGWYAMLGWRALRSLMPVARYESFYADSDVRSSTRQTNYTVGAVWQPLKQLRLQANYTYEDHAAPNARNKNVVSVMLTGSF
ncbi:MAG: OprO/OprP family phosphate-selective porin [Alistipes senegalensis]|nr:OprO/OprP family phosphate-selective porin [Bacteroides cellulosilyticus]MCM1352399.1 OprO/OprP family phosphate-selective porin [Alistipes senegalensis]